MVLTRGPVFTVASGATTSTQNDLQITDGQNWELVGFSMPAALTSTSISFKCSGDGVTFQPLDTEGGALVSITVAPNVTVGLTQDTRSRLGRWRFVQLVLGSAEGAQRTITALVK